MERTMLNLIEHHNRETRVADPRREDKETILLEKTWLTSGTFIDVVLQENPAIVGILNKYRQFIIINKSYFGVQGDDDEVKILGKRPGEVFECIHAKTMPSGCGGSRNCRFCSIINTLLDAMKEQRTITREVRLTTENSGSETALDLQVTAKPFFHEREQYVLLSMIDISSDKRKKVLESILFHDIINSASSLYSLFSLLKGSSGMFDEEMKKLIREGGEVADSLADLLNSLRDLTRAENRELEISWDRYAVEKLLREVVFTAEMLPVCKERRLGIELSCPEIDAETDEQLFKRILLNMIKNALEASENGGVIRVYAEADKEEISVSVHNEGSMSPEVQVQVFQRSFSTKGTNRGLGTYSMKLLGEQYLGGTISFISADEEGTVFTFRFPRVHRES